ncbi:MAG: ZIP family metal transporter [Nevskia sp.]|nr:ZIP family metal transporter [Nevskia sp.]
MTAIAVSLATFVMTLLGGLFALRFKDRLHLVLGFSAGALLSVAFFDLVPEAIVLAAPAWSATAVLTVVMAGFVGYLVLDRSLSPGRAEDEAIRKRWQRGALGAASLSVHSFIDGFVIGLAFRVSPSVGVVVSAAILTHDFSDGINTVGAVLGKQGGSRAAVGWLLLDAIAPVLGAASTLMLTARPEVLGLLLAVCGGCFIYMSASDLLPESYHDHPTRLTTLSSILGIVTLYLVTRLAS